MKKFIITEEQALLVLQTLQEFPAKHTLQAIDIIRAGIVIYNEDEVIALRKELSDIQTEADNKAKVKTKV